jgi:steroid delta-isomerase-like uncharacterized protein
MSDADRAATANVAALDRMYECWRTKDLDGLLSCFTEDCEYEDMALAETWRGHDGIRRFFDQVFAGMPDFVVVYTRRFATAQDGAGEWTITGTVQPGMAGLTTPRAVRFTGVSTYAFRGGRITQVRDCWDFRVLERQLTAPG